MKKVALLFMAAAVVYLCMGCAASIPSPQLFKDMERTAGEGESEIVVARVDGAVGSMMRVFVDNEERIKLSAFKNQTIIVPDGRHNIHATLPWYAWPANKSKVLTVDAASNRTVLLADGNLSFKLDKYMEGPLDGSEELPSDGNYTELPPKPDIAHSDDLPKIAVYVTGDVPNNEKEALGTRMLASLVNSGRYMGIERTNSFLAEIEKEHIKQRSGAIDDGQISELGKQYGVKFVCIAAITPAFGDFQVSARIVDVETARVVFIGDASGTLKSMADLELVSSQVVKKMFDGETSDSKLASNAPVKWTLYPAANYKYFTLGQKTGAAALNLFLPGVGSIAIMGDWTGAITQWALYGVGAPLILIGYYQSPSEPNTLLYIGASVAIAGYFYGSLRPATYKKKLPNLNLAILPNKDGNIGGYLAYRLEF